MERDLDMGNGRRLIRGAFILSAAGFLTRMIGFFYRIFLSHAIGAEGMGIYQLIFPLNMLCYALTVMGIQTAISRFVSAKMALDDPQGANSTFAVGTLYSLLLSGVTAWALYQSAPFLSEKILLEPRTLPMLKLMACSIPMGVVHTCVSGYFFARKKTGPPAVSQLLEQTARVAATYLAYTVILSKGLKPTPVIAVVGMLCGEAVAMLFSLAAVTWNLQAQDFSLSSIRQPFKILRDILPLSAPVTANRVLLTLLNSVEAILIPSRLRLSGASAVQALSVYGTLNGMAMPLVLFPSTITNAVSVMLLPSVSEAQARGNMRTIRWTVGSTLKYCLLLGIFSTGIFFFYGPRLGLFLFHNRTAGLFIRTLSFICPFLYMDATLSSILHGLGKTGLCFIINICGVSLRILMILFVVPFQGIQGYLWGLLASELLLAALSMGALRHHCKIRFDTSDWLIRPIAAMGISLGCSMFSAALLRSICSLPALLTLGIEMGVSSLLYLVILSCMGIILPPPIPDRQQRENVL